MSICIKDKTEAFAARYKDLIAFHVVASLLTAVMLLMFDFEIGAAITRKVAVAMCLTESVFICSPIWLLRGKWRLLVPVSISAVALFLWSNLMYHRYWNDLLPLSLIGETASYNSIVIKTVPGLIKIKDLSYLLLPGLSFAVYHILHMRRAPAQRWSVGIGAVLLSFILFAAGHCFQVLSAVKYWRGVGDNRSFGELMSAKLPGAKHFSRAETWTSHGLTLYLLDSFAADRASSIVLTSEIETEISEFLRERDRLCAVIPDSTFQQNRGKNLILIIVESLNSSYIGQIVSGRSVTPVLDTLLNEEGTVSCLSMITQIADGSSSDGQLMYNTGMLPLMEGAVAMLFGGNVWHSLAEDPAFASTGEVIVEKGGLWNHSVTSKSYHYGKLVDELSHDSVSMDAAAFHNGLKMIAAARHPFLVQITTLSMHNPFDDPNVKNVGWISDRVKADTERRYLLSLHEFDNALGDFISALKKSGVYDNSVIVIASDHNIAVSEKEKESGAESAVAFIALNTGLTESISRTVGQIDVYPTIREIMGRSGGWCGLGMSILDSRNNSAVDAAGKLYSGSGEQIDSLKHKAWDVSQLMIRSNFFSKHP